MCSGLWKNVYGLDFWTSGFYHRLDLLDLKEVFFWNIYLTFALYSFKESTQLYTSF